MIVLCTGIWVILQMMWRQWLQPQPLNLHSLVSLLICKTRGIEHAQAFAKAICFHLETHGQPALTLKSTALCFALFVMSQSCKFHVVGLSKLNDNASQCICRKVDRRWRAQNHWMIIFGVFLKENGWETTEVGTTPVRLPPIPGTSICWANSRVGDITSRPTPSLWGWCPGRIQWIFQWILCGEPRTYIYIYIYIYYIRSICLQ